MTVSGLGTPLDRFRQRPLERLRYSVTEANLLRHLDPAPQRVLDVACGNGVEAVRLAALGHDVTVLDPAGAMLSSAMETAELLDVADRLHAVQANALDTPILFPTHEFDLVLCHNLLQYVDTPREMLAAVLGPLRPGGLLSVLGPNRDFDPVHAAVREHAPAAAVELLADEEDEPVGAIVAELAELGVDEVVRYGVRCVCDLLDSIPDEPGFLADLERLEVELAGRMPHLLTARFFHLVARR